VKPVILAIGHDAEQIEQVQELAERLGAKLLTLSPRGSGARRPAPDRVVVDDWNRLDPSEARFAALVERLDALAQRT
jgi:hypothetical protein